MSVSKDRKKRRIHVWTNEYQMSELKKAFNTNPESTLSNLQPLARRLDIKIHVARTWFCKWQVQRGMKMEGSELSKNDIN